MTIKEYTNEIEGLTFWNRLEKETKVFKKCKLRYSQVNKDMRIFGTWDNGGFEGMESWSVIQDNFDRGNYVFVLGDEQSRYLEFLLQWYKTKLMGNTSDSIRIIAHVIKRKTYTWDERNLIHSAIEVKKNWN